MLDPTCQKLLPPITKLRRVHAFDEGEIKKDSGRPGDAETMLNEQDGWAQCSNTQSLQ